MQYKHFHGDACCHESWHGSTKEKTGHGCRAPFHRARGKMVSTPPCVQRIPHRFPFLSSLGPSLLRQVRCAAPFPSVLHGIQDHSFRKTLCTRCPTPRICTQATSGTNSGITPPWSRPPSMVWRRKPRRPLAPDPRQWWWLSPQQQRHRQQHR